MNTGKWLLAACMMWGLGACGDDDGRDDTELDMSCLIGKDWFYNGWLGDRREYVRNDLLQVIRFDPDQRWKTVEYGGRRTLQEGRWQAGDRTLTLVSDDGTTDHWTVLHSGGDYMEVNVNAVGVRSYTADAGWLEELTADAFYVNVWENGSCQTHIGADVRGNRNIREAGMIAGEGKYRTLSNEGYYWNEGNGRETGHPERVRFYFRIGSGREVKLEDRLGDRNMEQRSPEEVKLSVFVLQESRQLKVEWKPYADGESRVYYRLELLPPDLQENRAWFVSRLLAAGTAGMALSEATGGEVNRLREMREGQAYVVRLTALVLEEGVDVNDTFSYANVQAKTCFLTQGMLWQRAGG